MRPFLSRLTRFIIFASPPLLSSLLRFFSRPLFASDDYTKKPIGDLRYAAKGGDAIVAYQIGLFKIEKFQFA